jgi:phosphatidylserine/phosphatidylglycerophosphate/cardiolipin synthase-like enzyme
MATLNQLKAKWFIPLSGEILGVPCRRHTDYSVVGGQQLSVSTDGNMVTPLFDGQAYMFQWNQALALNAMLPDTEVYHTTWRMNRVHTLGGTTGTTALEDLRDAHAAGVAAYVLLSWHVNAKDNVKISMPELRSYGIDAFIDQRFPVFGSNHQKISIFKSPNGDMVLLGSIDVNTARWDRSAHATADPLRPDPMWLTHDTGVQITGPATADLDLCFRERWNDSSRTLGMMPIWNAPLISTRVATGPADGPHSVQVTRTYGLATSTSIAYSWYSRGEFTTWASYLNAISKATQYIYIEDQYFLPWGFPPRFNRSSIGDREVGRNVDVIYQLGQALRRGVNVAVLVPHKSDEGEIIGRMQIFQRNLGVNYLRSVSAEAGAGELVVAYLNNGTDDIYVHSKLMLVDDEFTLIGSTNVNARSMTHDSEVQVGIVDADEAFTREFRKALWAEHTGRPPADFHSTATGFTRFRDSSTAVPPGRLRAYVPEPTDVYPVRPNTAVPWQHQRTLSTVIDPFAGPPRLA